jgi:anti-sigma B factor antagonist
VSTDREDAAIGAAEAMARATRRLRDRAHLLAAPTRARTPRPRTAAHDQRISSRALVELDPGSVHGHAVIRVTGEMDVASAPLLRTHVLDVIRAGHRHVVVDMRAVTFVDSAALSALLAGLRRLRTAGGDLRLVGGGHELERLLRITGVDRMLPLYSSVQEAATATP